MFLFRKSRPLTLESLDARVRDIEARLALRDVPAADNPPDRRRRATLDEALASYARSAGLRIAKREPV